MLSGNSYKTELKESQIFFIFFYKIPYYSPPKINKKTHIG